jgi:hypothetical protein
MSIRELMGLTTAPMLEEAAEGGSGSGGEGDAGGGSLATGAGAGDSGKEEKGSGNDDGAQTVLDMIQDEEVKQQAEGLDKFKSVDDLAKSYKHLEQMQGKEHIPVPSDENDTAWEDVLARLGRPEDPNGYELPNVDEEAKFSPSEEFTENLKQKAHELGLTQKQTEEFFRWYVEDVGESYVDQMNQQAEQFRQEAEQKLRKEFGNAYNDNIKAAQEAVQNLDDNGEFAQMLENTGLGNHPAMVKALSKIGMELREDTVGGDTQPVGRTPQQAKEEINSLKQSDEFMKKYLNRTEVGHDEAVQRMNDLFKDAYPDG